MVRNRIVNIGGYLVLAQVLSQCVTLMDPDHEEVGDIVVAADLGQPDQGVGDLFAVAPRNVSPLLIPKVKIGQLLDQNGCL